jgi:predicted lactoylglutathione lyase
MAGPSLRISLVDLPGRDVTWVVSAGRKPADTSNDTPRYTGCTEALLELSCGSGTAGMEQAVAAGGSHAIDSMDRGFPYGWTFSDPDGHHRKVSRVDLPAI